jgi:putative selenium metabolism hydrolase
MIDRKELDAWEMSVREEIVDFTRLLCRTPSISGQEGTMAQTLAAKMRELGYDEVWTDKVGNVIGLVHGRAGGPAVMFNSHMDHVDPGERSNWTQDPYGGEIVDGYMYGRGASDVKGGMGPQLYAGAFLKQRRDAWSGTFVFSGVIMEEPAESFGMRVLLRDTLPEKGIRCDAVVINEATSLNLSLGHKGRAEFEVETLGKTSHGSAPWLGINAIYKMLPVLSRIQAIGELPEDPVFGKPTVAPTIIGCSPGRLSIIPDRCSVSLDHRYVPRDGYEPVMKKIEAILREEEGRDPQFRGQVRIREVEEVSYTGYREKVKKMLPAFLLSTESPLFRQAESALKELGEAPRQVLWYFGTDGGCSTTEFGIPSIGYSPCEEVYAHVPDDRVSLEFIRRGTLGNAAIAWALVGK